MTRFGSISSDFDLVTSIGRYNTEATSNSSSASTATVTVEKYLTVQADGHGLATDQQSDTPTSGYQIIRKIWYKSNSFESSNVTTWTLVNTFDANTSYASTESYFNDLLKTSTYGSIPFTIAQTWEEVEVYDGLLDTYGGAAAAYSVRRLSSSYTGSLIEIERVSDSTTLDIGYDSNGDLDTSAIESFCSGTTCGVRTWYDQSSNGNDAVQTTQANQPTIYTGGAVVLENGEAALDFDGVDDRMIPSSDINASASNYEIFAVSNSATDGTSFFFDARSGRLLLDAQSTVITGNGDAYWDGVNNIANKFTADIQSVKTWLLDNTNNNSAAVYENGSLHAGSLPYTQRAIAGITRIGNSSFDNRGWTGYLQELVFYATTASGNRTDIETNINDYFGIYTPFTTGLLDDYGGAAAAYSLRRLSSTYTGPLIRVRRASDNAEQDISADIEGNLNTGALAAFCAGTDGFCKVWYDQSSGGNDATQTTAANQPKIYDSSTGVILENGKPAIQTDGSDDRLVLGSTISFTDLTWFTVTKKNDTTQYNSVIFLGGGTNAFGGDDVDNRGNPFLQAPGAPIIRNTLGNNSASGGEINQHLSYYNRNGTNASGGLNGEVNSEATVATTAFGLTELFQYSSIYSYEGLVQELVLYASDQTANRTGIETNINDFYSIYP